MNKLLQSSFQKHVSLYCNSFRAKAWMEVTVSIRIHDIPLRFHLQISLKCSMGTKMQTVERVLADEWSLAMIGSPPHRWCSMMKTIVCCTVFFFLIGWWLRKRKKRIEFARVSFKALIPCRKPKSNENGKYNGEIERGREWRLGFSSGSAMWAYVHMM